MISNFKNAFEKIGGNFFFKVLSLLWFISFGVDVFYKKIYIEKVHGKKGREKSVIMDILRKFAFCKEYFSDVWTR